MRLVAVAVIVDGLDGQQSIKINKEGKGIFFKLSFFKIPGISLIILFFFPSQRRMHKFFFLLLQQIWNIEQEKDREKEKVGGRPATLNEKKGDRGLEREINNKGDIFLFEEQHENFVAAVTKWEMLVATNAR